MLQVFAAEKAISFENFHLNLPGESATAVNFIKKQILAFSANSPVHDCGYGVHVLCHSMFGAIGLLLQGESGIQGSVASQKLM